MQRLVVAGALALALAFAAPAAVAAEAVSVKAVMTPKESMKMTFGDGSQRFVLLVRREGTANGTGAFAGAAVTEYGWHDIDPPFGGDPHGYLQFRTAGGDVANVKWTVRAVFVKGKGKPRLVDYGHWELVSGSGKFAAMIGVGTLTIKPASETDRLFTLDGEIGPKP